MFSIILAKLARIDKMEYINKTDAFELSVKKLIASIPAATNEKNYAQLFSDLILVIGMVGNIKSPVGTDSYIKRFDDGLKKSYKETEYIYFKNTDDYIVQCIEND